MIYVSLKNLRKSVQSAKSAFYHTNTINFEFPNIISIFNGLKFIQRSIRDRVLVNAGF